MTPLRCHAFRTLVFCTLTTCCPTCEPCNPTNMSIYSNKSKRKHNYFTVDSGATIHCINDLSLFVDFDASKKVNITVANKQVLVGQGVGTVILPLTDTNGQVKNVVLHNCVYHPNFSTNLISVKRLWKDSRISTHFGDKNSLKCQFSNTKYHFDPCNYSFTAHSVHKHTPSNTSHDPLHARFGHPSPERLKQLISHSIGLPDKAYGPTT